jgi:hypothetical protein
MAHREKPVGSMEARKRAWFRFSWRSSQPKGESVVDIFVRLGAWDSAGRFSGNRVLLVLGS